ncbi:hypothetical protein ORV05_01265 [Amycolatopsis cynarae]|uniref:Uncharacterized protein n=1 Tax=Amycolatopsis cynarae TaxID=2995223 RepID=A0ABY7B2F2_9PSEU|nr:hypothetical protein [Amycolatopsis sp. HUAS 11-8]WAL66482.1 hypothetical protein ORV05_01265 [Amycolatopsis sp. HUAS 11-8]
MSYDLAVWEGDRPASDKAAADVFRLLCERHIESGSQEPPSDRIRAFALALLDRYPDISEQDGEDSPWSTAPLMSEAVGPLMYFPMVWSRCEEVSAWASQLATEHGLVCYDPQLDRLRP